MTDGLVYDIPFPILNLALVTEGNNTVTTFKNSLRLAKRRHRQAPIMNLHRRCEILKEL